MEKFKFILLLLLILYVPFNNIAHNFNSEIIHQDENEMTLNNIMNEMIISELKCVDILMSQVKLETGNLKHIKNNNLFGFRKSEYMSFVTWQDCIKYCKEWQDKHYNGGDYFLFLKKIKYAEDVEYIIKLKNIMKKH